MTREPETRPAREAHHAGLGQERGALVRQAELLISGVLRWGVAVSAGTIVVGVVLYVVSSARGMPPTTGATPHTLGAVARGVLHGEPAAITMLGLLVLLATPLVRVIISIVAFLLEGDRLYAFITSLVLLILLVSFLIGRGGA